MALSSLNKEDCFILDGGKGQEILVYMPDGASRMERFKATQAANEIRDEDHAGDGTVEIIDAFSDNKEKFFEALGEGSADEVAENSGEDDATAERAASNVVLYKVSGEGDNISVTQVSEKPLAQGLLNQEVKTDFQADFALFFTSFL